MTILNESITKHTRVNVKKVNKSVTGFEDGMGRCMTEKQKMIFLVIDEWWKKWGFGPSIRDICEIRGKGGMGNTYDIINRLVKLGVVKKVKGKVRSVRPVYINFRELE